jgi:hypothetical protein
MVDLDYAFLFQPQRIRPMLFPAISSRFQPSTALPSADRAPNAFSEEETTVFMMLEPSSRVESIPTPQLDAQKRLNAALNQMEATQVAKQYSSPDMFLSEQVGNPQKAKESFEKLGILHALFAGGAVWGINSVLQELIQPLVNKNNARKLTNEAQIHRDLASLAQDSEKYSLLGEVANALKPKDLSKTARDILTGIQNNSNATVAELHKALAAFKQIQAKEALESTAFKSKWIPPIIGAFVAATSLYSAYSSSPQAEKRQIETNRRNRAILNQAGRDITVLQAKENFPEYFSALACSQSRQT